MVDLFALSQARAKMQPKKPSLISTLIVVGSVLAAIASGVALYIKG